MGEPGESASHVPRPLPDLRQLGDLVEVAQVAAIVRAFGTDIILDWSRGAEELYGWTASEAVGQVSHTLLATRFPNSKEATDKALLENGNWSGELGNTHRDGQPVVVASRQVVHHDEHGQPTATLELNINVTDRRRADEDGRASDERFRLLVDHVQDYAIFMLSPEGRVMTWNDGARRLKGYTADEIVGQHFGRFYTEEDRARGLPQQLLSKATADGRVEHEGWRVRKDGSLFWADVVITALRDEHGELRGFAKIVRDLTERKQAEEDRANASRAEGARAAAEAAQTALRASRDQLAAILSGVADGIMAFDASGRVLFSNDAAARLCGFDSTAELMGASQDAIVKRFELFDERGAPLPRSQLPTRLAFADVDPEHIPPETLVRFRDKATGEERASLVSAKAIRDESARVVMAVSIFRDVTERLRAEDAARFLSAVNLELTRSLDYEQTLRRLAELAVPSLADWCVIDMLAPDGQLRRLAIAHVDPDKARFAGQLRALPANGTGIVAEAMRTGKPRMLADIADAQLEAGARSAEEVELVRSLRLRSVIVVPLRTRERTLGAITLVTAEWGRRYGQRDLALAEDLAVRAGLAVENAMLYRESQDQTATQVELNNALREAIETRDEFLAAVSHDLKSPIASIKGIAQLAVRRLARPAEITADGLRSQFARIDSIATRAAEQVEELLDIARLEMNQPLVLDTQPIDLVALVQEVMTEHQGQSDRHQISFDASVSELIGTWDRQRLTRVLLNLLENAVKYSPEGGPIRVRLDGDGEPLGWAVLSIEDNGVGIPDDELPRIFERFRRGTNVIGRIAGSGIGLASAKHIVEGHGGSISAASRPGQGTTFTVRLPLNGE